VDDIDIWLAAVDGPTVPNLRLDTAISTTDTVIGRECRAASISA